MVAAKKDTYPKAETYSKTETYNKTETDAKYQLKGSYATAVSSYTKAESDRGLAEVIISKQRNGPTDSVQLVFLDQFMRFDNRHFGNEPGR